MAFVTQSGNRFQVRHGGAFYLLKTFGSRAEAERYKDALHREHDPLQSNRNAAARKAFNMSDNSMSAALKRRKRG